VTNSNGVAIKRGAPSPATDAFRFGRNWQRYVNTHLDPDRERIAAESLDDLLGDVAGKSFIDIGCGSGLFSLCAHRAGARHVISVDVDRDSVAATRQLHAAAGSPYSWQVLHGSILDPALVKELGGADIVYSWGVLHHTGDMHAAIRNAAQLVGPGGDLAIAIYNRVTDRWLSSERWWRIKRVYNHTPRAGQVAMELIYALYWVAGRLRNRQNPIRVARSYRRSRGMALWTDLVDWLGGYPYEFATADEIIAFCEEQCGLRRTKVVPVQGNGTGNSQFVFERPAAG
jgi:2-polyprenyl-6-hydroxyphenyl methylase/3-demethylubiquinone-9 3-methyltransferase